MLSVVTMPKTDFEKLSDKIDKMRKEVNTRLDGLEKKFSQQFAAIMKEREEFVVRLDGLQKENESVRKRNQFLEREVTKNEIIINGLPVTDNDANRITIGVIQQLKVNINSDDIDNCFLMKAQNKSNNGNSIKLKLVRFAKKQEIMRAFTEARRKGNGFKVAGRNVYFNDSLPVDIREILVKSKKLVAEKKVLAAWVFRGQVYVRTNNDMGQRMLVSHIKDLDSLCSDRDEGGRANSSSSSICLVEN